MGAEKDKDVARVGNTESIVLNVNDQSVVRRDREGRECGGWRGGKLECNVGEGVVRVNKLSSRGQETIGIDVELSGKVLVANKDSILAGKGNISDCSLSVLGIGVGDQVERSNGRSADGTGAG